MNKQASVLRTGVATVALSAIAILAGCGGSGNADPAGIFPDSITITDLTGTDSGNVGDTFTMYVTVVTTGDVPGNQITYTWEQTAGGAINSTRQNNSDYHSNFSFVPTAKGNITIKVKARTNSGRESSQSKTVRVN